MSDKFEGSMPVYRLPRRGGMDAGTRRLLMIAGGLAGALVLVFGLAAVGGHHRGAVPVIEADSAPVRVKPENPGGMAIAGQDDEILSNATTPDTSKLAPAAEAPALQALRAEEAAEAARAAAAHARTAAPPPAVATAPPAPPAQAAAAAAPPAAAEPRAQGHATPASLPLAAPAARGAEPGRAAESRATEPPRGTQVQLGALSTEAAASQEWARLSHRAPDLLGTRHPQVTKFERAGHTLWRLRTGGFADVAEATLFCERARAKGMACSIAAF